MNKAAILLIVLALGYRLLPTVDLAWANFPPMMALAFCGAVYFRDRRLWLLPFAGLCLTDLYINWFYAREYGYHMDVAAYVARAASFGLALGLGAWVSRRKSWLWLLNGSLVGALLFYLITNTQSWFGDAFYAKTLAGWWQAMTVGHPEYPPTIYFFRNTLFGDMMFTGLFAGVMEWLARRSEEPSLLDDETEETEGEEKPAEVEAKE
ncbi:MAG TPA: DUF6580 family putative transport protein [Lacunisphaera sp.]|nr:DUF6580 family putative transport protein [Lacunisphaera sp.]